MQSRSLLVISALFAMSCGGDAPPVVAPAPKAQLRVVSGGTGRDSIQAQLSQPLMVEVTIGGAPAPGIGVVLSTRQGVTGSNGVTFAATRGGPSPTNSYSATTDASGRISAWPTLGTIAGQAFVSITTTSLALTDSTTYVIEPGAGLAMQVAVLDTAISPRAAYQIGASVRDRLGNPRTLAYSIVSGSSTVDANGLVRGSASPGRTLVKVQDGALTATSSSVVVPEDLFIIREANLFRARLDRSQRTAMTNPFVSEGTVFFPDGHTVVYFATGTDANGASDMGLYVGDTRAPTTPPKRIIPRTAIQYFIGTLEVSIDGQWIYFTGNSPVSLASAWRVHPDGSQLEALSPTTGYQLDPSGSPDGKLAAWSEVATRSVIVFNIATRTQVSVLTGGATHPMFSPDGTRLAYLSSNLAIMNPDGTGRKFCQFPMSGFNGYIAWTRDSQWIIANDNSFMFMVNVATCEATRIPGFEYVINVKLAPEVTSP